MPYAILIWGQRGVYIHAWPGRPTISGNGGPTAGCIHVSESDAPAIYGYVDARTRITISYPW
ncbi:L,D-transpeptidase [Paraliomyxa miuraensis]|uniref:L,D-transpeptidase n=1 Tax=Paraliomyxa miuraensis TaxID=376150 RepID=UPI00389A4477